VSWDPITRIVGSLGIHTKIDFANRRVAECHSTSSIFRGYSVFMKGKDPRDAHFITSRICGICGDNHATCACYAQNMAFGVVPPALAEWIINLGEAAEYMFDHNLFQDNLVGVDFCEQMVKETNPSVLIKAENTRAPHGDLHGFRTIADIMRALNPFTGSFYREALQMSRLTREMFCLMEGRHVHPSTLYPGGVGTVATIQLFTDYLTRLMRYIEFMKKVVPMHDDLFDFFYEALPGYEKVGYRRTLLGCWGSFNNPDVCDYTYKNMSKWGDNMFVTPGVVVDGKLVTTDETFERRGACVISSIGSIPEAIPGIPMKGELFAFTDWDVGRLDGYPNLFSVGNVVTGKGNIVASRKHAAQVYEDALASFLGLAEDGHAKEAALASDAQAGAREAADRVASALAGTAPPAPDVANAILARVRERQRAVGYDGHLPTWLAKVTPPDLE
jgi:hypothetical protein